MKNDYYRSNPRGGFGILSILGFFSAVILVVGLLDKAGVEISLKGDKSRSEEVQIYDGSLEEADSRSGTEVTIGPDSPYRNTRKEYQAPASYENYNREQPQRSTSTNALSADDFLRRFSEMAIDQALTEGVPAGLSLALGLSKAEKGVRIDNWNDFLREAVLPLLRVKEQAPRQDKQMYFKYSANSERWADGLGKAGAFSSRALQKAMQQYGLSRYDQQVRTALVEGVSVNPEVERKASFVADEVTSNMLQRRNTSSTSSRTKERSSAPSSEREEKWEGYYDEVVGREVAKEIAKRKLKSGKYISEGDMAKLVEETNQETNKAMKNNLSFLGREINRNHPEAPEMLDITKPENAQARQELYQRKLQEKSYVSNK